MIFLMFVHVTIYHFPNLFSAKNVDTPLSNGDCHIDCLSAARSEALIASSPFRQTMLFRTTCNEGTKQSLFTKIEFDCSLKVRFFCLGGG